MSVSPGEGRWEFGAWGQLRAGSSFPLQSYLLLGGHQAALNLLFPFRLLDAASQEAGRRREIVMKPRSSGHGLGGFESDLEEKARFRIYPQGLTQNSEVWYLGMKSGAWGKRHKIMKKKCSL